MITNNTINNSTRGIYAHVGCNNANISDNVVFNVTWAIQLQDNCLYSEINENTVFNASIAIIVYQICDNATVTSNTVFDGSSGIYGWASDNCIFQNNTIHDFTNGFFLEVGEFNRIENNTVYNIQCTPGGTEYNLHGAGILIRSVLTGRAGVGICTNNIISNCRKGISVFGNGSMGYLDYNNLFACATDYIGVIKGEHDINVDPQFVDPNAGDFRLKPTSPCLNAGKPTASGGFTDMGAWQGVSHSVILPENCTEFLPMDFDNDCKVDYMDLAIFSQNWLDCNLEPAELCLQ